MNQVLLTLTIQRTIKFIDDEDYMQKRDQFIKELEMLGLTVDLESEDDL